MAAGSATLVTEGATHRVDRPEVIPLAEVDDVFTAGDRRAQRLFGIEEGLRLRTVTTEADEPEPHPT